MKKIWNVARWILLAIVIVGVLGAAAVWGIDYYVESTGKERMTSLDAAPESDAILVLGAYVTPDGQVSEMLRDRLDMGYALYAAGKAPKIIVSGDHGTVSYDEVNAMRAYLQEKGVPRADIFMDHAGFDTYDSLCRAKDVFMAQKLLVVSQAYHLYRALYIAKQIGLDAAGVGADTYEYPGMPYYRLREYPARVKAFLQAQVFKPEPKFLGDPIPVWGDGIVTGDGKE